MGQRTQYTPGTFSWTDLTTTDPAAAKEFYTGLLGWQFTEMPAGDGVEYSMAAVGGSWVAAVSPQPQQQRDAGVPPTWNSYITVQDVDAAAARAVELGGSVHAGPFDVMEAGRMAVVRDPQGAWFQIWQPRQHHGAGLVNAPGALCWNELGTPDAAGAAEFYGSLFGWTTAPVQDADPPYLVIRTADGHTNGGIRPPAPPEAPPAWLVYFATADIDASSAAVARLGGGVMVEPMDIGVARISVVRDPQGAVFALYAGDLDE